MKYFQRLENLKKTVQLLFSNSSTTILNQVKVLSKSILILILIHFI